MRRTISLLALATVAFGSFGFAQVEQTNSEVLPAVCMNLTEDSPLRVIFPQRSCVSTGRMPVAEAQS